MTLHDASLERVKKQLRSVLISEKNGVAIDRLQSDYQDLVRPSLLFSIFFAQVGQSIPFVSLGFPSLESLLRSLPDVCSLEPRGGGQVVLGVASSATAHVQEMVVKQNQSKRGRRKGGQFGGGWSRGYRTRGSYGMEDLSDEDIYSGFEVMGGGTTFGPQAVEGDRTVKCFIGQDEEQNCYSEVMEPRIETEIGISRNCDDLKTSEEVKSKKGLQKLMDTTEQNIGLCNQENLSDEMSMISKEAELPRETMEEEIEKVDVLKSNDVFKWDEVEEIVLRMIGVNGMFSMQVEKMFLESQSRPLPSNWKQMLEKKGNLQVLLKNGVTVCFKPPTPTKIKVNTQELEAASILANGITGGCESFKEHSTKEKENNVEIFKTKTMKTSAVIAALGLVIFGCWVWKKM